MSELSKQAGLLSIADFLRFVIKTLIGMALARLLLPADLGTYRQIHLIYATLSGILLLGFPQGMMYFLPKAKDEEQIRRIISRTMDVVTLLALACALVMLGARYFIADNFQNPSLIPLLGIFSIYPLLLFYGSLYNFSMLGLKKPGKAAVFALFSIISDLIIILAVAFLMHSLEAIIWASLASAVLQWLWAFIGLRKKRNPISLSNYEGFKEQISYTIPLGISFIVGILCVQLDKIMISGFFLPEEFAVFSLGAMELPLIGVLINSVNAILLPNLNPEDHDQSAAIFRSSVRKNSLLIMPLAVVFYLFASELMLFFYGKTYIDAAIYFRIYLFILPLRTATHALIFQAYGRTKLVMLDSLIMLGANAVLNYILIRQIGMKGAAIATVIVSWLMVIIYLAQMKHYLKIKVNRFFPWLKMLFSLAVAILPALIIMPLLKLIAIPFLRMIVFGSLYMMIYFLIARALKLIRSDDISMALELLRSLVGFSRNRGVPQMDKERGI